MTYRNCNARDIAALLEQKAVQFPSQILSQSKNTDIKPLHPRLHSHPKSRLRPSFSIFSLELTTMSKLVVIALLGMLALAAAVEVDLQKEKKVRDYIALTANALAL